MKERRMKRFLLVMLACIMVAGTFCNIAVAEAGPNEIGPYPGETSLISGVSAVTGTDSDRIVDEIVQRLVLTYVPSAEEYEKAENVIDLYNEINSENVAVMSETRSSYDDNWRKLRYGNLIEITLDYDEGITNSVALRCLTLSDTAKSKAQSNFSQYWDSAQHFMWNFAMTKEKSKTIARTIGNNHEWGISMITPMLKAYKQSYDKYIGKGYSEKNASDKALADTIVYMPEFKYDAVSVMKSSYSFFKSFFSAESIMDLWNNCYGRAYPAKGYTSDVNAFRYSAFTAKELVLDGSSGMAANLTETHIKNVWSWDWYSY